MQGVNFIMLKGPGKVVKKVDIKEVCFVTIEGSYKVKNFKNKMYPSKYCQRLETFCRLNEIRFLFAKRRKKRACLGWYPRIAGWVLTNTPIKPELMFLASNIILNKFV